LLCQKKDLIIQKFDELLKKLGGEELSANITMGKVSKEWSEAMSVSVAYQTHTSLHNQHGAVFLQF